MTDPGKELELLREVQDAQEAQMIADSLNVEPAMVDLVDELRKPGEAVHTYDPVGGLFDE